MKHTSGRLLDFFTTAWHSKRVWLRNCESVPTCVAELHLENTGVVGRPPVDVEVHLTREECKALRAALKRALKEHKAA